MKTKIFLAIALLATLCGSAEAAVSYSSTASGPWSTSTIWSGSAGGYPGSLGMTDSATVSSGTVTVDGNYSIWSLALSGSGVVMPSGTRTLTLTSGGTAITYTGTNGNTGVGGIVTTASNSLTLTNTASGVLMQCTTASSGYGVAPTGGSLSMLCATGGTAMDFRGSGHGFHPSGGTSTWNGIFSIASVATGYGSQISGVSTVWNQNGNVVWNAASNAGIRTYAGLLTLNGLPISAQAIGLNALNAPIYDGSGGTVNWTGAQSVPAGTFCYISGNAGTISLAGLSLSNSGQVLLSLNAGTFSQGNGTLTNATSAAQIVGVNCTPTITGPLIPSGSNVLTTAPAFGYSSGTVAGTWNTVAPNQVLTSGTYGVLGNATTGTATTPSGSDVWTGVTYGVGSNGSTGILSLSTSLVLTSGTIHGGAGTYNASNLSLTGSDVRSGVLFGYSSTGTLTSGGTLDTGFILAPHVLIGSGTGTLTLPPAGGVLSPSYSGYSGMSGLLHWGTGGTANVGTATTPPATKTLWGTTYGANSNSQTGTLVPRRGRP